MGKSRSKYSREFKLEAVRLVVEQNRTVGDVAESVRRVVISMPSSHPWKDLWRRAATRVVAIA